jgi:hypothetical protein
MNHQNLVNTGQFHPTHGQSMPNIGFHTPGHVTMNINMNMYPNVMNINMNGYNTTVPQVGYNSYQSPVQAHPLNQKDSQIGPNFNSYMGFDKKSSWQTPTSQKLNNISLEVTGGDNN